MKLAREAGSILEIEEEINTVFHTPAVKNGSLRNKYPAGLPACHSKQPPEKKRKARMARHYYDLYRLIGAGIGRKAAGDLELFERIVAHRQVYFRFTWMNYDTMHQGRLRLVPPNEQLAHWKSDYANERRDVFWKASGV